MARAKHPHTQHVGEAIRDLLQAYHLKPRFDEANLMANWEKFVGKPMARATRKLAIRDRVLFVELSSPAMKQDLSYHKARVMAAIHQEYGSDTITEIVLM
ncbi:MAG: DUF721 domain-containing protein [Cyclobacteriaceae bacterium]|nr:DUF721 domain-containing protein [Cyclobacteriaceae bacterium]